MSDLDPRNYVVSGEDYEDVCLERARLRTELDRLRKPLRAWATRFDSHIQDRLAYPEERALRAAMSEETLNRWTDMALNPTGKPRIEYVELVDEGDGYRFHAYPHSTPQLDWSAGHSLPPPYVKHTTTRAEWEAQCRKNWPSVTDFRWRK